MLVVAIPRYTPTRRKLTEALVRMREIVLVKFKKETLGEGVKMWWPPELTS